MAKPQLCVIVSTYQRPANLRRVLASIAAQQVSAGTIEVVVADDGSRDETPDVVQQFRRQAHSPVRFVTHPHAGFCPARCRNEGAAASQAEYLLFLDGDCLIPPDHVPIHLARRARGVVHVGDCVRLTEAVSAKITEQAVAAGGFAAQAPPAERSKLWWKACRSWMYEVLRHDRKPALIGNNFGIWRDDYFRVNGFDENYVGWGCEDDDFGLRLRRAGVTLKTMLWWTYAYHLWHPTDPSMPARWRQGQNIDYFRRDFFLARCGNGLVKRPVEDLNVQIIGKTPPSNLLRRVVPAWCLLQKRSSARPEVEVLFAPSKHSFSGQADCNILVVPEPSRDFIPQCSRAHLLLTDHPWPYVTPAHQFGLAELQSALEFLLLGERREARATRAAA